MNKINRLILPFILLTACTKTVTPPSTATFLPPTPTYPVIEPTLTLTEPMLTPTDVPEPTPIKMENAYPAATEVNDAAVPEPIPIYTYQIVDSYPHDSAAWIQGLVIEDGVFYEGVGQYGISSLRKVDVETGEVLELVEIPEQYFGEGVTTFGDQLYQLTWREHTGFIYDKNTFELLGTWEYPTEGWGLTHNGEHLIMSDGTNVLRFLDPATLEEVDRRNVMALDQPVQRLNELEFVNGEIFANIWQTDVIARIDPDSGQVVGWINLWGILMPEDRTQPVDVLNGIAYDAVEDRLYVTGKLWPKLFEIDLILQE